MRLLYNLGIQLYYLFILIASPFNSKAKQWLRGRVGLMQRIAEKVDPKTPLIWFHCSSLGEFEQGRPVIEKIRQVSPAKKILLTFYSPSGYEVRKNYPGVDYVFYLPLDTRGNAKQFLDLIPIEKAFFVKYEFWYHFLSELGRQNIPVYLISGIFRENQVFFKWYGSWYRKILGLFDHLFVQQKSSMDLLGKFGIKNVSVSGDTRFDRVHEIAENVSSDLRFELFSKDSTCIIAGSTWPEDEEILSKYINETLHPCKWIIAPHEIHHSGIERLMGQIKRKTQRYTSLDEDLIEFTDVIIIDTIGILSSLYQYGNIAYIGGGFGKGIHNTLEAATFGNLILFGPNFHKFQEASDLVNLQAAFPISTYIGFKETLDGLLMDNTLLKTSGQAAETYVKSMIGASSLIVDFTFNSLSKV